MKAADLICLHGPEWSLVLERRAYAQPVWRHLGARVDPSDLPPLASVRGVTTFSPDSDVPMPVFPVGGAGWFGPAATALRDSNGVAFNPDFGECAVEVSSDALLLELTDNVTGLSCTLKFELNPGGALVCSTSLTNNSDQHITVDRLASLTLPLPAGTDEILSWRGRHNAEFSPCREAMPGQSWMRETRGGLAGHGGPPGCYVLAEAAGRDHGLVLALQLAWSGDSRLIIERSDEGFWTCMAEAKLRGGEIVLEPGETHSAPPAILAISTAGTNCAMQQQHDAVRSRVTWPSGAMRPRPVHLNSWEGCYFAHDEARMMRLAGGAAEIGVERFVLDDGWFKGRSSDSAGLGDWTPDPVKYPNGLAPLARHVQSLDMEFGLWVEPEMVSPDSDLYRAHPGWALAAEGRDRPTARNQLVLDMRRAEVRDYLYECLDTLLSEVAISYLKWDQNRAHSPSGGSAQTRGTYALLERLRAAHPDVEIESCAAGGGRIDAGIAAHTHRFWPSDNIDAVTRIAVQRGFLAFMPPEMMGAHVGASPSHATGRSQSLDFSAAIACQGHFGVELDPAALNARERKRLGNWIAFYKQWRGTIHGGETRLGEGSDGIRWHAQGNGDEFLLWVVRADHAADKRGQPLPLAFADGRDWDVRLLRQTGLVPPVPAGCADAFVGMRTDAQLFTGSWLAQAGLPVPVLSAEAAAIFHLKARP